MNNYSCNTAGKLYGVGVGPGDPELITLKALRIISESPVIGTPGRSISSSIALNIVNNAIADKSVLGNKEIFLVDSPMTSNEKDLLLAHRSCADRIISYLKAGLDVAVLTLGDPTIYSTYIYVHRLVQEAGYGTEIISGVPSFCAVAAKSSDSLVDQSEQLHIIPACYGIEDTVSLSGTKVYMKAGSRFNEIREFLCDKHGYFVENCGMSEEKIYTDINTLPDKGSYFSLGIVK